MITPSDIQTSHSRIKPHIVRTPVIRALTLSRELGCEVYLKLENLQLTGSFKVRGALNTLMQLSTAEKKRGVIACSAGNHAQGVAFQAAQMGVPATIIMPQNTPAKKIMATEAYGATVILHGDTFQDSLDEAKKRADKKNMVFISPYNDERIIAGQGTIGIEILEDIPNLDAVIVPVGGGGLIAGISHYIKNINKKVKVISAESESWASAYNLFRNGEYKPQPSTLAEGIAVKAVGSVPKPYLKKHVDDFLVASEDAIEDALYDFITREKLVVEGAAATGLAVLKKHKKQFKGKKVCLVVCGGNIDTALVTHILTRGLFRDGIYATLQFETDDRPGVLADITRALADCGANIVEVDHSRLFRNLSVKKASLEITIETRGKAHLDDIKLQLSGKGFNFKVIGF